MMPLSPRAAQPFRVRDRRFVARAGFTVIEASVAGAVITIFLASLFALNSNMMHLLRGASEAANASQELQTSIEKIRLGNWNQITDATWFTNQFFSVPTDAQTNLPGMKETIKVSTFASPASPAPTANIPVAQPFTVTFQNKVATADNTNSTNTAALQQQELIRIDVTVQWPSLYRQRSRSMTTVVSRWGISK